MVMNTNWGVVVLEDICIYIMVVVSINLYIHLHGIMLL